MALSTSSTASITKGAYSPTVLPTTTSYYCTPPEGHWQVQQTVSLQVEQTVSQPRKRHLSLIDNAV
jgi:hypothetical protein